MTLLAGWNSFGCGAGETKILEKLVLAAESLFFLVVADDDVLDGFRLFLALPAFLFMLLCRKKDAVENIFAVVLFSYREGFVGVKLCVTVVAKHDVESCGLVFFEIR